MYNYLVRRNNFSKGFIDERLDLKSFMKTNIKEVDDKYLFEIELPGFNKEDIKLSIEDGNFKITVKRELEEKEENTKLLSVERFYGEESRSFHVGSVIKDNISANYNNGILSVTIPKDLEAENKKYISIN